MKKTDGESEELKALIQEYTNKGPLRLRRFAITALNIGADVVDGWTDFDYMVNYCARKKLGLSLPSEPEDKSTTTYSDGEFDASEMEDKEDEKDSSDFDDEMEAGDGDLFGDDVSAEEDEEEEEEAPPPPPVVAKKKRARVQEEATPVHRAEPIGDPNVLLSSLLDLVTNQGVILDKLRKSVDSLETTTRQVYVRQEATHHGVSVVAKALFSMSAAFSEFFPRALKAMRFKPQITKDVKSIADAAGVNAEQLVNSLLDPEAD